MVDFSGRGDVQALRKDLAAKRVVSVVVQRSVGGQQHPTHFCRANEAEVFPAVEVPDHPGGEVSVRDGIAVETHPSNVGGAVGNNVDYQPRISTGSCSVEIYRSNSSKIDSANIPHIGFALLKGQVDLPAACGGNQRGVITFSQSRVLSRQVAQVVEVVRRKRLTVSSGCCRVVRYAALPATELRLYVAVGVILHEPPIGCNTQAVGVGDLAESRIQVKPLAGTVVDRPSYQELSGRTPDRRQRAAVGVVQKVVEAKADVAASSKASLNFAARTG